MATTAQGTSVFGNIAITSFNALNYSAIGGVNAVPHGLVDAAGAGVTPTAVIVTGGMTGVSADAVNVSFTNPNAVPNVVQILAF